ncbi:MAG TPA: hypothetical protein VMZ71_17610 [Gemmataceae bacterium]|nr:hypothetical protein [Gemmataceae bacterium]
MLDPVREELTAAAFEKLPPASRAIDQRRKRPLYFDGRFLAARDLTREQNYFLTRQADLGVAVGAGVVRGLVAGLDGNRLKITAGSGITTAGESVVLAGDLAIPVEDVAEVQKIDAAFGLTLLPSEPPRNRTGLFVVALRPVEYTANPIAGYPTTVGGTRTVEDGDVIEAVVVTLVPYPDDAARTTAHRRRSRVAHDVFVRGGGPGVPASALPLAVVSLNRGVPEWCDPFLVRREVGAAQGDVLGLGLAPRALREAHVQQYNRQFDELLDGGAPPRFPASEYFLALPPVGRMPAKAIDATTFTQFYFPASVRTDIAIIPDDELPALVEEGMTLPPIDLTLPDDEQDSTSVLVLLPVPRDEWRKRRAALSTLTRSLPAAAPNLIARRLPIDMLVRLPFPRLPAPTPAAAAADTEWENALKPTTVLWYVRRRNLGVQADAGAAVRPTQGVVADENALRTRFQAIGQINALNQLRQEATLGGYLELVRFLSAPGFERSVLVTRGAASEMTGLTLLDEAAVRRVEARYSHHGLGEGANRLQDQQPTLAAGKPVALLLNGRVVSEFDRLGLKAGSKLAAIAQTLAQSAALAQSDLVDVVKRELKKLEDLEQ